MSNKQQSAAKQYFSDIWSGVVSTYKGLRLTLRYFFTPKVTMEYPEVRPQIPEGHRGIHRYFEAQCMLCRACEKTCPVDCIVIEAVGKGKNALITRFDIDYSKCLFCNLCCEACNPSCIHMGDEYDLSTATRDGCILHFAREKTKEEIAAHLKKLEEMEAEKKAKAEALKQKSQGQKASGTEEKTEDK